MSTSKTAIVLGATGLVGKELMRLLEEDPDYENINLISRRPIGLRSKKISEVLVQDLEEIENHKSLFDVNHVFCCLGTTMKKAGSSSAFKKIDFDHPLKMAQIAKKCPDFKSFHVVTAVGAKATSSLFYNQVKGELEDALKDLELPGLKIYQPSLLLGKREDFRWIEEIGKGLSALLSFFVTGKSLGRLWSIHSYDVAKSMVVVARQERPGIEVFKPGDMLKLSKGIL